MTIHPCSDHQHVIWDMPKVNRGHGTRRSLYSTRVNLNLVLIHSPAIPFGNPREQTVFSQA